MDKASKIYIAGHRGMVGTAIMRKLKNFGFTNLLTRTSTELDLLNQKAVEDFFNEEKPEFVFIAAAKVGGILANNIYQAQFLYNNLQIQTNIIHAAYINQVKKLMCFGSSCIYPKLAPQPLKEEYLLTGPLEPTNEPYAIAKIAGIKLCDYYRAQYGCNYISVMPTSLYGYNDNYHPQNSHVIPAMIRKFHEAKEQNLPQVTIWGSGTPRREFMFVDDLADASCYLMENYNEAGPINVGIGDDISIRELAELIKQTVGYVGVINYDSSKPDGTPRKLMDVTKMKERGWSPRIELKEGIKLAYQDFVKKQESNMVEA